MKIAKPRWLPAVLTCIVSTVFVAVRPTDATSGVPTAQQPESSDVVFRHFL